MIDMDKRGLELDKDEYIVSFHFNLKNSKLFKWIKTLSFYIQERHG